MGFAIFLIAVVAAICVGFTLYERQRSNAVGTLAKELNIDFSRQLGVLVRARLPEFSILRCKGCAYHYCTNALTQSIEGGTVVVFDQMVVESQWQILSRTVAYIRLPRRRLPSFLLRPKGSLDKFTAIFGTKDICTDEDCRTQDPEFCNRYFLSGPEPTAICDVFSGSLRSFLNQMNDCSIEAKGDELVVVHKTLLPAEELVTFREIVLALLQILRDPPVDSDQRTALHIPQHV